MRIINISKRNETIFTKSYRDNKLILYGPFSDKDEAWGKELIKTKFMLGFRENECLLKKNER